ncbi:MAG: DNA polymerase III subunit gamma/tau [Nitrospinae bacterium]|nr:DNA polymerase III subunit gamma/tau [Nitrospinota bacterium]
MAESSAQHGNYLVMARKWRPATFADVVGQHHIVRSLQNAIQMNRIAGAYLFSGMRGVGKTSMARIFARSINCEKGPTLAPCGVCANCREIAEGNSLDVVEIDGASNNKVEDVHGILDHIQYAPVKCRMKIYIIDEVHMLSTSAFNALLKTLEEPPPHTVFIMATTEQNKVPETVISRCQCFEFRAISDEQIAGRLQTIASNEKLNITDGALRMIARRAEGSMRDAQSLLDQAAAYSGETIDEEALGLALGLVSREKIWAVLDAVARRDVDAALGQLHALYYSGFDVAVLIRELFEAVRTLTVIKVSGSPEKILSEPPDSLAAARELVKDVSAGRLQQFYDLLLRARSQSAVAGNPLSVLEMALIKMVRLDDLVPVADILDRLRGTAVAPQPSVARQPAKPFPASNRESSPAAALVIRREAEQFAAPRVATGGEPWVMIRSAIAEKRPLLGHALEKIVDFAIEGGKAVLSYPEEQTLLRKQCEESRELIESEIEKNLGKKLVFVLAPAVKSAKTVQEKKSPSLDQKLRKEMLEDPIIQKAVDLFDGRPGFEDDSGN